VRFVYETVIPAPVMRVFAFHEHPDALRRLLPPFQKAHVVKAPESLHPGARAVLRLRLAPLFWVTWVAEHTAYSPNEMFQDVQISGPFRRWVHTHLFRPVPAGTALRDEVDCEPPCGRLAEPLVRRQLRRVFRFRHDAARAACTG
jgi:ligand-binding SRPBCC domain-containing protein